MTFYFQIHTDKITKLIHQINLNKKYHDPIVNTSRNLRVYIKTFILLQPDEQTD